MSEITPDNDVLKLLNISTIVIYFCLVWLKRMVLSTRAPFLLSIACYWIFHSRQQEGKLLFSKALRHFLGGTKMLSPLQEQFSFCLCVRHLCSLFYTKLLDSLLKQDSGKLDGEMWQWFKGCWQEWWGKSSFKKLCINKYLLLIALFTGLWGQWQW